jgi:hypothetical protein
MRRAVVTTVVTPAADHVLANVATLKDDWGISGTADDAFLGRAIGRCSAAAEQYCNRIFAYETVQDRVSLSCEGWPHMIVRDLQAIQLSRWPLAAVTSVTVDGTALIEGTDFIKDAANGRLLRLDSDGRTRTWCGALVIVVYAAGFVLPAWDATQFPGIPTLPFDIEDAVGRMVYTRYSERKRDPLIKAEKAEGVYSVEYLVPSGDGNLSPDVADLLDNYRVPVIA